MTAGVAGLSVFGVGFIAKLYPRQESDHPIRESGGVGLEPSSLHPVSSAMVAEYLATLPDGLDIDVSTDSSQQALTGGLGAWLARRQPVFAADGLSLTGWEARVDRGISMMLRPPSRLFVEAGVAPERVRKLPVRVDLHGAVMGGCYIPSHLIPQVEERLDQKLEVTVQTDDRRRNSMPFAAVGHDGGSPVRAGKRTWTLRGFRFDRLTGFADLATGRNRGFPACRSGSSLTGYRRSASAETTRTGQSALQPDEPPNGKARTGLTLTRSGQPCYHSLVSTLA